MLEINILYLIIYLLAQYFVSVTFTIMVLMLSYN